MQGYIRSKNEPINWPLMSKTLYNKQPLINLLNMNAGDRHTVNKRSIELWVQKHIIVI